ncbi:hypothetical protein BGZ91_009967, partial [Linnemannia elongata]
MGSWSATTGPNAPFNNGPVGKADQFSFTQGIAAWSGAGFPLSKIVVGTAFYGRSVTTTVNMNTQNPISMYVNKTNVTPKGGPADRNDINFFCNEGSVYSGMWKWKEILPVTTTVTTTSGPVTTTPATGICSGVAAWNKDTIYATSGTKVTYAGHLFTNSWWTQNETPD